MAKHRIFTTSVASVYPHYVTKAEKKGRSKDEADEIIRRGRKILTRFFDYRVTSLQYIDLANGKPAGVYPKLETGKLNKKIVAAADRYKDKVRRKVAKQNARSDKGDEE